MATPSNMPAYAQGNAQAAAAAKAEAARLAAAQKAKPAPTPAPAPAPQATTKPAVSQNVGVPPKANAAPVSTPKPTPSLVSAPIEKPVGMPSYAISNEAAAKYSLANTYDTIAADAKAKADAQAAAFKSIVAPQTDSILKSIASSPTETDDQKRARLLKDGSVAIRARTMTPEQQKAMWGIVIDPNGGAQIAPPAPQQAKPDQSFLTPQFTQPTVAPSAPQMPVYATGDVNKIQDYTASNVAPMTDAEKQKAFIDAVNTRANVLDSLGGSKVIPSSSTAIQNQAIQDVMNNMGIAQGRTSVSPPAEQPISATLGEMSKPTIAPSTQQSTGAISGEAAKPTVTDFAKAVSPSTILPSGLVLGEAAKYDTPQAQNLLTSLAKETYGTAPKDVFATNVVEKPVVQQQQQQQQQQQETQKQQEVQQLPKSPVYGDTNEKGQRYIGGLGWVSPDVFAQAEANTKGIPTALSNYTPTPVTPTTGTTGTTGTTSGYKPEGGNLIASDTTGTQVGLGYDAEQKRLAEEKAKKDAEEAKKAADFKQLLGTPIESVNADGSTRTPDQAAQELANRQKAQEIINSGNVTPSEKLALGQGPISDEKLKEIAGIEPPTEFQYYGGYQPPKFQLDKNEVPTIQPPETATPTEDAFRVIAQKQVDENIAKQTADLDLQIKQATENRDFNTAQQLKAYKSALGDIQNQAFLSGQGITQGMANRGLLNSGMYSDALLRSSMGSQQQIRQLAQTQQSNIEKATLDFNQLQEKINKQRNDILSGRATDIEKATKQLQQDQATADKAKADILKQKMDQQNTEWNSFQTALLDAAKANDQDIRQLVPYLATRDKQQVLAFLQSSGNLPLTTAGLQAIQELNYRGTQNDKTLQDMYGIEYSGGSPIVDKKGNYIKTLDAISKETDQARKDADLALRQQQQSDLNEYRSKQLKIQQQNANTSAQKATGSGTTKTPKTKYPPYSQQQKLISDRLKPILTNVYLDDNGYKTTKVPAPAVNSAGVKVIPNPVQTYLSPENVDKFNSEMRDLYESGLVSDEALKQAYVYQKQPLPPWFTTKRNLNDIINENW